MSEPVVPITCKKVGGVTRSESSCFVEGNSHRDLCTVHPRSGADLQAAAEPAGPFFHALNANSS